MKPSDGKVRLNLGCGSEKIEGMWGVDINPAVGPDIVADLYRRPWPFGDSVADEVRAFNFIEHVPDVPAAMEEIHRISKPGALVTIKTPHFASLTSWEDPTHRHHFAFESFDYFCVNSSHPDYYSAARFEFVNLHVNFGGSVWDKIGRWLCRRNRRRYERRWCFIFRPMSFIITLRVVK